MALVGRHPPAVVPRQRGARSGRRAGAPVTRPVMFRKWREAGLEQRRPLEESRSAEGYYGLRPQAPAPPGRGAVLAVAVGTRQLWRRSDSQALRVAPHSLAQLAQSRTQAKCGIGCGSRVAAAFRGGRELVRRWRPRSTLSCSTRSNHHVTVSIKSQTRGIRVVDDSVDRLFDGALDTGR